MHWCNSNCNHQKTVEQRIHNIHTLTTYAIKVRRTSSDLLQPELLTLTIAICSIPSSSDLQQYDLKGPHIVGIGASAAFSTNLSLFLLYLPSPNYITSQKIFRDTVSLITDEILDTKTIKKRTLAGIKPRRKRTTILIFFIC